MTDPAGFVPGPGRDRGVFVPGKFWLSEPPHPGVAGALQEHLAHKKQPPPKDAEVFHKVMFQSFLSAVHLAKGHVHHTVGYKCFVPPEFWGIRDQVRP